MIAVRIEAAPPPGPRVLPVRAGAAPAVAAADGFSGEAGTVCELLGGADGPVLLAGVGDGSAAALIDAGARAARRWGRFREIVVDARGMAAGEAALFTQGVALGAWRFSLASRLDPEAPVLAAAVLVSDAAETRAVWTAAAAGAQATLFARGLVAEPGNRLNPSTFAAHLAPLVAAGVALEEIAGETLRDLGAGGLLAVGSGSPHPPRLIVLRWAGEGAPLALVGKGITFDTGGICIKPADKMWEMRGDMSGAAACAGAMLAIARRRCRRAAMAVLAVAENAIGGGSYRPGDVLRTVSGRTVEVVDTDAEGRLVLADAIAWAAREKPSAIVDIATLTGSAIVALGHHRAALFSGDDALAGRLAAAARAVGEPLWRLPIGEAHRRALDSDIADLRHCVPGRGQPDACQAAAFLREFADGVPWAHVDMAAVDLELTDDGEMGGPSGYGARLLAAVAVGAA